MGSVVYSKKQLDAHKAKQGKKTEEQIRKEEMDALMAARPTYSSIAKNDKLLDAFTLKAQGDIAAGQLTPELQAKLDQIKLDTRGLDAFRGEALRTAGQPSVWAKTQLEKLALDRAMAQETGQAAANREAAGALSQLAMRGGAGGGSRLLLARNAANQSMKAAQEAKRAEMMGSLGVQSQDETNRIGMLSQLPGMEVQALQPELQKTQMWSTMASGDRDAKLRSDLENRQYSTDVSKFNLGNLMTDRSNKNNFAMDAWKQRGSIYAANRSAAATEKAGGGGCFITTAVCEHSGKPDNCYELELLRSFRDNFMMQDSKMAMDVIAYYMIAPVLVERIKQDPKSGEIFEGLYHHYIRPCVGLIESNQLKAGYEHYKSMVRSLKVKFYGED